MRLKCATAHIANCIIASSSDSPGVLVSMLIAIGRYRTGPYMVWLMVWRINHTIFPLDRNNSRKSRSTPDTRTSTSARFDHIIMVLEYVEIFRLGCILA